MVGANILIIFCVANFLPFALNYRKFYDGHSLIKVTPRTYEDLDFLYSLAAHNTMGISFWNVPLELNSAVDMVVPPKCDIFNQLNFHSIPFETRIEDFGKFFREQYDEDAPGRKGFFEKYNTLREIYDFLQDITRRFSHLATLIEVGRSYENRPIYAVKLSNSKNSRKPIIWIQSGVHAAEHIGPAVTTYMLNQFVKECSRGLDTTLMLDSFDWYILPVGNPDGYVYSFEVDRLWRKTRSFNPNKPECYGADFNRNWNFHWNETETGTVTARDPCTDYFIGLAPFSEAESRAVSNFLMTLSGRLLVFMDFHCYAQKWMPPWGYTKNEFPPNYDEQVELAKIATTALTAVHGTPFKVGSSATIMNVVSGGSRDWAYAIARARYSYTVELRDTGKYGFLLPDTQIKPSGEETWEGMKAFGFNLALRQTRNRSLKNGS